MELGQTESLKKNGVKKVLVIAYYWPPAGGPGVQRWLKFSKYLPENGWQPTLLVPDGASYPVLDETLTEEVPHHLEVIKVPIFEPYEAAIKLFQGKKSAERLGSVAQSNKPSLTRFLMMWSRGNLLLPDPRVLWRRKARKKAFEVLQSAKASGTPFDAIVTTGPPHSVHLIGLDIKRKLGLPWLSDFRDLWREIDYLEDFHPTSRTRRAHATMERDVIEASDAVSYPTPGVGLSLQAVDRKPAKGKMHLIHNGWDPADLPQSDISKRNQTDSHQFQLGHFGSLFPVRDAPGLWEAIRNWNDNVEGEQKPIHLNLVGSVNASVAASIQLHLKPEEWTDHGYVSHGKAIEMMMEMNALLLLQSNNETGERCIPGKAFEYLATGRPMAVVTPVPSDLDEIAREWKLQPTGHDDVDGATQMLKGLFTHNSERRAHIDRFSRKTLTTLLASALDTMAQRNNH